MSTYLLTATPARGHVMPLLAVAEHLTSSGHRVLFMTGSRYSADVEATGASFVPIPAEAEIDFDNLNAAYPERAKLRGVAAIRFDIMLFVRPGTAQYAAVLDILAEESVDAIITEPTFTGAALIWAMPRDQRPPVVGVGIAPLGVKSRDTAPFGLALPPLPGRRGRVRNALLNYLAESVLFAPIKRESDALAIAAIGRPLEGAVLDWTARTDAVVQFTVPAFEYPRSDLPGHIHFVGPVSKASTAADLPPWWSDLTRPGRVVHVTQGTVANEDFDQLIVPACVALGEEDLLVVVTTGGRAPDTLPPLPANVRVAQYLPYDKLLPLTDVLVTNGGYGGVQQALSHGIPLVVAGRTEDKAEVAARVAWSGTGIDLKTGRPTPAQLRKAVREVLSNPAFGDRAAAVEAEMDQAPGMAGLDRVIADLTSGTLADPRLRSASWGRSGSASFDRQKESSTP